MRPFFKRPNRQRGLVLLIILIIVVLGSLTVLVSNLSYTDIQIAKQRQTMLALAQAKAALLGFAASYAETHPGQPVGYLPCPDQTGDGSTDVATAGSSPCSTTGKTVLGRFPWRTLGLPPLRDGDGECLWYAVSGNYKDNPKVTLTSDTNGRFIVQDVNGHVIAGSSPENRAIAIIFAPGKPVGSQVRGGSSGTETECGRASAPNDLINQASNYLEPVTIGGSYTISNHEGAVYTFTSAGTKKYLGVTHAGIVDANGTSEPAITPLTYDPAPTITNRLFFNNTANCDTQELKECRSIFVTDSTVSNDTLMLITPEDYKSIYTRMDLWVAKKVTDCITTYVGNNEKAYFNNPDYTDAIDAYKAHFNDEVQRYANLKEMQLRAKFNKEGNIPTASDIATARDNAVQNVIDTEKKYPWASRVDDVDDAVYTDEPGERFGRIPTTLSNVGVDMKNVWSDTTPSDTEPPYNPPLPNPLPPGDCFDESESGNFKWSWWDEWKKMVFYAVNWKNVPAGAGDTYIWVKLESTKCGNCSSSICKTKVGTTNECWMSWVADLAAPVDELTSDDTDLMQQKNLEIAWHDVMDTKRNTFAKMEEDNGVWEWINGCSPPYYSDYYLCRVCTPSQSHASACGPTPSELTLTTINKNGGTSNSSVDFVILVAGRSLSLNSYQQLRDPTTNSDWFWVKNYLEDDNIPGTGEVDTIPSGDETFVRKPISSSFNDAVCMNGSYSSWNCVIP